MKKTFQFKFLIVILMPMTSLGLKLPRFFGSGMVLQSGISVIKLFFGILDGATTINTKTINITIIM